jgi:DNA-directed RNA polymerase subunit L
VDVCNQYNDPTLLEMLNKHHLEEKSFKCLPYESEKPQNDTFQLDVVVKGSDRALQHAKNIVEDFIHDVTT